MKVSKFLLVVALGLFLVRPAMAGQLRVYVAPFKVVTTDSRQEEMRVALQELFASRIGTGDILPIETPAGARFQVLGRYTVVGNVFSIDVVAKDAAGSVVARAYEQGSNRDELIPSLGKVAQRVEALLLQGEGRKGTAGGNSSQLELPKGIVAEPAAKGAVVKTTEEGGVSSQWLSQRLPERFVAMAPGRSLADGGRELYLASEHALLLYRQGKKLQLLAEVPFKKDEQLIALDTADLDGDGAPEVYVTLYNGRALVSQVWVAENTGLRMLAEKLPYYLRALALDGKQKKVYAQKMSMREDFFGEIYQLYKDREKFGVKEAMKLPRNGYLYNFNRFGDNQGNSYYLELSEDGLLSVIAGSGEELWQSKEKYAGSETFFRREYLTDARFNGEPYRKVFLKQRIHVTPEGEVILPTSGTSKIGHGFSNNYLCGFTWNGSSLEKKWHTTESDSYLADYFYDGTKQELVRLEVVKEPGMFDKGASIVSVQRLN